MPLPICIAVIGAECTGKTTLARQLAPALAQATGRRVAWVPEWLREWCEVHGRTPRADEQAAIATVQHERIEAAAAAHDIVVCDTSALMTTVYSRIVFGDRSLDTMAVALHRGMAHTLLMAVDLPWVSDGRQREGPQVQVPVDDALRELLHGHGLPYSVVAGRGEKRLAQALAASSTVVQRCAAIGEAGTARARATAPVRSAGLFTGLPAADGQPAEVKTPARWVCECCVPEAERALWALRALRNLRDLRA